jgi:hypothetical protein
MGRQRVGVANSHDEIAKEAYRADGAFFVAPFRHSDETMTQRRGERDEHNGESERGRVDGRGATTHRMVGSHLVAFAAQTALPLLFRLPP